MSSMEPIDPNVDPYGFMGLVNNTDGTVTRVPTPNFMLTTTPPCSDPSSPNPVLTKDVFINREKNTFVRIYLPRPEPAATKVPLIFYYHGGGFVVAMGAAFTMFHKFCCDLALQIRAVVVSVDYRLAPEHRLPAAYDDCMEALHWSRTTDDEWLTNCADRSKCFLMGTSAGGNIAYHVGLRAACVDQLMMPLKIRGLILHHSFFGGVERTPSEIRLAHNKVVPLIALDICWDLALPIGADRDHQYCNIMKHIPTLIVDKIKNLGWRFLVTGDDSDPLIDMQIELVNTLRERGVNVMDKFSNGGFHGVELLDEAKASILYGAIKNFLLDF